jgi:hypothetical protein
MKTPPNLFGQLLFGVLTFVRPIAIATFFLRCILISKAFFSLSKILDRYRKRLFRQSQVDPHPRRAARQRRRQPGVNVIKPFSSSPTLTSKQARMVVRGKFFFSLV